MRQFYHFLVALVLLCLSLMTQTARGTAVPEELQSNYGYRATGYIMLIFYPVINNPALLNNWLISNSYTFLCPFLNLPVNNCLRPVLGTELATRYLIAYFNANCCQGGASLDGNWGTWTSWGSCSASCQPGGLRTRVRFCNNPAPYGRGLSCRGESVITEACNDAQSCAPVANGSWSTWSTWSACSATCGGGSQTRTRLCNSPAPANGGAACVGSSSETAVCNQQPSDSTKLDGNWGAWGSLSVCNATCGLGTQTRTRLCNNPAPAGCGANCPGFNIQMFYCFSMKCRIDPPVINGTWSTWSTWNVCSATCGGGSQTRTRLCNNPAPASGGAACVGSDTETAVCNTRVCNRQCGKYTAPPPRPTGKIMGGQPADPGEYPWACHLALRGDVLCACAVVDNDHVLTAGHCLDFYVRNNYLNTSAFSVIAGQTNRSIEVLEPGAQHAAVLGGVRHENYNSVYLFNDISVLRLATPLIFNDRVSPVCLPSPGDVMPSICTVVGWGYTKYIRDLATVLLEVEMYAYNSTECESIFQSTTTYDIRNYLNPGIMCAANETYGGRDSCEGDSGSSLICLQTDSYGQYWKQFGIVSSGFYGCGDIGQPGYYTYLPNYITWIQSTIAYLNSIVG